MKYTIDPGRKRPSVNFIDNITFSHVKDLDGNDLDLYQPGNRQFSGCLAADTAAQTKIS